MEPAGAAWLRARRAGVMIEPSNRRRGMGVRDMLLLAAVAVVYVMGRVFSGGRFP